MKKAGRLGGWEAGRLGSRLLDTGYWILDAGR